jgi:hypothetical protein
LSFFFSIHFFNQTFLAFCFFNAEKCPGASALKRSGHFGTLTFFLSGITVETRSLRAAQGELLCEPLEVSVKLLKSWEFRADIRNLFAGFGFVSPEKFNSGVSRNKPKTAL